MLKCESRISLHAVQYKWQPGFFSCFVLIILRMSREKLKTLCREKMKTL